MDEYDRLKRRLVSARQQIQTSAIMTALFMGFSFFFRSGFWFLPMVFAGVIPLIEGIGRQRKLRQKLDEIDYTPKRFLIRPETRRGNERPVKRSSGGSAVNPEVLAFRTARDHGGIVTPALLTLEGGISLDDSERILEDLVTRGYATMDITDDGKIVYIFSEFKPDTGDAARG